MMVNDGKNGYWLVANVDRLWFAEKWGIMGMFRGMYSLQRYDSLVSPRMPTLNRKHIIDHGISERLHSRIPIYPLVNFHIAMENHHV
jgi:hypothetical protein